METAADELVSLEDDEDDDGEPVLEELKVELVVV